MRVLGQGARNGIAVSILLMCAGTDSRAQSRPRRDPVTVPVATSELRDSVAVYSTDRGGLLRRWAVPNSPARRERLRAFYADWRSRLARVAFDRLSQEGKIDWVLLDNRLRWELDELAREERLAAETASLVPFAAAITGFEEARRSFAAVQSPLVARQLAALSEQLDSLTRALRPASRSDGAAAPTAAARVIAARAGDQVDELGRILRDWHRFYAGYDPVFTWWTSDPYRRVAAALPRYARAIRENLLGQREGAIAPIVGNPLGAEALRADLAFELIPYTPEELIALAERELAWCETEMRRAARDMGLGDDWRAALERVKQAHVEPGRQPQLVRDLAREAVEFITRRNLVTVPPLADEIWRMEMMSPQQQLVSPFFLGGEVIRVAYPTDSMAHDDKLMSMRGNNPHFSRATVHHELIPGHHLQGFMTARYQAHRQLFSTPFWGEGWALYWEMLLWDLGFPGTPEDRVGMLFWRSHRAARIIFSLRFHLGTMSPQEAIDFLVERVGHERANAEAEVRRSFGGNYSPLYQAAYMLGGLQFRALHAELVGTGRMTDRAFHDAILQGGRMPVEMVRARLTGAPLSRDYQATWRFIAASSPAR